MLTPIFISVVNNQHTKRLDTKLHAKRKKQEYTLIKVRSTQRLALEDKDILDMQISPMELVYKSEIIYNVLEQKFSKSRFGASGENISTNLPDSIKPLFEAIISVSANKTIEELKDLHNKQNLIEALYLTDKYGQYYKHFDIIEYQLLRLKYGKEVPYEYFADIEEKFPEYLI